jgi:hypothetical protein
LSTDDRGTLVDRLEQVFTLKTVLRLTSSLSRS